jgi:hypothetical protein
MATIRCPGASETIIVTGGKMCAYGDVTVVRQGTGQVVSVQVFAGSVNCQNQTAPSKATIAGGSWTCSGLVVPAPGSGSMTLCVWETIVSSTNRTSQLFNATTGTSGHDCCKDLLQMHLQGAAELAGTTQLEVTIPDGPQAGHHSAKAVGEAKWELTLAGGTYTFSLCSQRYLALKGAEETVGPLSVDTEPFSALFAGAVFGAAGEVVVTKP